jgi:phosphate transport system substrate-binding protein
LATVSLPENLVAWVPDPPGKESYPIVTFTWLLCYRKYDDAKKLTALKDVIAYCLGQDLTAIQDIQTWTGEFG